MNPEHTIEQIRKFVETGYTSVAAKFAKSALQHYDLRDLSKGRFKMPEDNQLVELAILFNDGKVDKNQLVNMVAMSQFIIDRLYENGDITKQSSKEVPK